MGVHGNSWAWWLHIAFSVRSKSGLIGARQREVVSASVQPAPTRAAFVLGCPRSGTTLLQLMPHAHPRIALPPETLPQSLKSMGDPQRASRLRRTAGLRRSGGARQPGRARALDHMPQGDPLP
ncbi:sulfotransferase [Streptomyces sp. NPDC007095]|uniref:sulfotransferase n=1 Tax=Streptomyces sp. NPDC007095 TaxID=3154482 RepID=UPI0033E48006